MIQRVEAVSAYSGKGTLAGYSPLVQSYERVAQLTLLRRYLIVKKE